MSNDTRTKQQLIRELDIIYQNLEEMDRTKAGSLTAQELLFHASTTVQKLFDMAYILILVLDRNGNVILINKRGCSILEGTEEQILHRNWFDTFAPQSIRDDLKKVFSSLMQGKGEFYKEYSNSILTLSGRERTILWTNTILRDSTGTINAILSSGEDITELERQRKELEISEEKHRILVEASMDAIFLETVDGKIVDCNTRACKMFGYTKAEFLELSVFELIPPDFRSEVTKLISHEVVTGGFSVEAYNVRKDGSIFPVEVNSRILKLAGAPISIVYVRDIGERKKNQKIREAQAQRLEVLREIDKFILSEKSPAEVARYAVTRIRRLITCYKAIILEYLPDSEELEVLSDDATNSIPISSSGTMSLASWLQFKTVLLAHGIYSFKSCDELLAHLPTLTIEHSGNRCSVATIPLLFRNELIGVCLLFYEQSAHLQEDEIQILQEVSNQVAIAIHQARLINQVNDYTFFLEQKVENRTSELRERVNEVEQLYRKNRKLIEKLRTKNRKLQASASRLAKANDELEAFSYSISHDLRAHVRRVDYYSHLLATECSQALAREGQQYLDRIIGETMNMDLMIKDILDYSHIMREQSQLTPVSLAESVFSTLKTLEHEIERTKAKIEIKTDLPAVLGNRTILAGILYNLLSNAIKFVEAGVIPQITIEAEVVDETVRLSIRDNGIGIHPSVQGKIYNLFERFVEAEAYPGTGVGLAIVKRGLQRIGGEISLVSKPGEGSTFILSLKKAP